MPQNGRRKGNRPDAGNGHARTQEALQAAAEAGLRYVSDDEPGITRRGRGKGWSYHAPDGSLIRDRKARERIAALAIPPAWSEVWICRDARGHIQATGRDDAGRKQYRYHEKWIEVRDATKFDRLIRFGEKLPAIRERVEAAMRKRSLSRDKVLATVIRLLETTCMRVGNDEYARENGTYGLTTIRKRHVDLQGSTIRFSFEGKGDQLIEVSVRDARIARVVRECQDLPGYELFKYIDVNGDRQDVKSEDVNAWIREVSGEDFTAKDFRTWMATVHAFTRLAQFDTEGDDEDPDLDAHCLIAVDYVAEQLRNTRAVSRASYIHPGVLDAYTNGEHGLFTVKRVRRKNCMDREEVALLRLLRAGPGAGSGAGSSSKDGG
jgi:DNA topoisomerase-1